MSNITPLPVQLTYLDFVQRLVSHSFQVSDLLQKFDEHPIAECHKFGVIYQKYGQTCEEELFGNIDHPDSLDEFLNMLGTKVELKGFSG